MVEEYLDYIDKKECERRGFIKTKDGYYKQNTLERYYSKGWLNYGTLRHNANERLSAGNRLAIDFYKSKIAPVSANDVSKVRVDGGGTSNTPDSILDARTRFNAACNAVPFEFWGVVSRVCCDDKELIITGKTARQRAYDKHNAAMLLCLGLDRLIDHYKEKK